MSGMYPSNSRMSMYFAFPQKVTLPSGFSDASVLSYQTDLSKLKLVVTNPHNQLICSTFLNGTLPIGVTISSFDAYGLTVSFGTALFEVDSGGLCFGSLEVNVATFHDYTYSVSTDTSTWGGIADDINSLAQTLQFLNTVQLNKIEPNSATVPTLITLFADDGVTAIATRTIANADGTPVSPKQVLSLGPWTPI